MRATFDPADQMLEHTVKDFLGEAISRHQRKFGCAPRWICVSDSMYGIFGKLVNSYNWLPDGPRKLLGINVRRVGSMKGYSMSVASRKAGRTARMKRINLRYRKQLAKLEASLIGKPATALTFAAITAALADIDHKYIAECSAMGASTSPLKQYSSWVKASDRANIMFTIPVI